MISDNIAEIPGIVIKYGYSEDYSKNAEVLNYRDEIIPNAYAVISVNANDDLINYIRTSMIGQDYYFSIGGF